MAPLHEGQLPIRIHTLRLLLLFVLWLLGLLHWFWSDALLSLESTVATDGWNVGGWADIV